MQYLGGKARQARHIAPILIEAIKQGSGTYYEPFLGGASVFARVAPHASRAYGSDIHPDLILMWRAVQAGWLPPDSVTREEYAALRHAEPSALRGFVGFGCSFGGKWFGGYASRRITPKNPYSSPYASHLVVSRQSVTVRDAVIRLSDYRDIGPRRGDVVYCDPPYANTTGYSTGDFDSGEFWNYCRKWAESGALVYVSEYAAPEGVPAVWHGKAAKTLRKDENTKLGEAVEKLFFLPAKLTLDTGAE